MKAKLFKLSNESYKLTSLDGKFVIQGKLSLKNCQSIELGCDLDELFNEVDKSIDFHEFCITSFKLGFQKALEILGDKKFSEEDILKAMKEYALTWKNENEIIQSLQQTEWNVEIECIKSYSTIGRTPKVKDSRQYELKPKLDANNCLILKRVEL